MLGGISVLSAVCEHNQSSGLSDKIGKEASHKYVSESVKQILEEQVTESNPFSREREVKQVYHDKPRGSPYTGLRESELERFILRMMEMYRVKF